MIKLYVADFSPLMKAALYTACYELSTRERRDKADKRRCHPDKAACIVAGLLLKYAYKQFAKGLADANSFDACEEAAETEEVSLESLMADSLKTLPMPVETEAENGKPCFAAGTSPFFNLSHSGDKVVCIMADKEVGVDIQRVTEVKESVVKKCFLPEEMELLAQTEAGEKSEDRDREREREREREKIFTGIWSGKEAVAKLSGRGLSEILEKSSCDALVFSWWLDEEYVISYACHRK